ncbi:hypothetical protein [Hyphomicrobium sp. ghe19]|uniref:hypothetical protein n=1 Tax=Hyphomicrobium sp. ghe19 TaxID=2682968 RepID=UPI0013669072|nr:hypothetical protein HYPP_02364 [Hyphomicrobium sp. ghe19]
MLRVIVVLPALMCFSAHASAASGQECQSLWKTIDVDANGSLTRQEDTKGYITSFEKSGGKLLQADALSRDEFLSFCKTDFTTVATQSPSNTKDFGKGDLTPGTHPLAEEDALKKLEANGFKDVRDLALDDKGIWRGTAFADGKEKPVGVDPQGDIVAQPGDAPEQRESMSPVGLPQLAEETTAAATPATPLAATPAVVSSDGGQRAGLALWLWIIIANAISIVFLSSVGGQRSAMGRTDAR